MEVVIRGLEFRTLEIVEVPALDSYPLRLTAHRFGMNVKAI
jgi:hypothetical protein